MNITESPKFAQMCHNYLTCLKDELDSLRADIEQMNFENIHQFAHKTKGTAGTYQLEDIASKAKLLQQYADAQEAENVTSIFNELCDLVVSKLQNQ